MLDARYCFPDAWCYNFFFVFLKNVIFYFYLVYFLVFFNLLMNTFLNKVFCLLLIFFYYFFFLCIPCFHASKYDIFYSFPIVLALYILFVFVNVLGILFFVKVLLPKCKVSVLLFCTAR